MPCNSDSLQVEVLSENKMRITYNSGKQVIESNITVWGVTDGHWHQVAFSEAEEIVQVFVDKSTTTLETPWTKLTEYKQVPFIQRGKIHKLIVFRSLLFKIVFLKTSVFFGDGTPVSDI